VASLELEPIGFVRTGKDLKFQTPHQPDASSGESNEIVLNPGNQFELALEDLAGFDRIWLVWWFHKNKTWRPRAMPPRGPAKRRGLFATRSPHRPNPIGLTCVPLLSIEGLTLKVGPLDLIDGTPILDIKPYISTIDAYPDAGLGWISEMEQEIANAPRFDIEVTELATMQLEWLSQRGIEFKEKAFESLSIDPRPHRTRRILKLAENSFRMACGPWRIYFHLEADSVIVDRIDKGYADETLVKPGYEKITDREAQIDFSLAFLQKD